MRFLFGAVALLLSLAPAVAQYQLPGAGACAGGIIRQADRACIPPDPGNQDWQFYQLWAEHNTPGAAAPAPSAASVVSKAQFLALFSAAELTQISAAARSSDAVNVWLITALA